MSAQPENIDFDPDYIAGLLDAVGRVRFDTNETPDGEYSVRPALRLKPSRSQLRAAVIGEFLEKRGYQYNFVERNYGDQFFTLRKRSDLKDLQSFLEGRSGTLIRELTFVNGRFADEFDFEILAAQEFYRFLLTRDKLRFGWTPRGRHHTTPEDFAENHDVDIIGTRAPSLPLGAVRADPSIEWVAGVFDGACRFRLNISENGTYKIGYVMSPISRLYSPGVSPGFIDQITQLLDNNNLTYGNSSDQCQLRVSFTNPDNIQTVLELLFPHLLVLAEAAQTLIHDIFPRFRADEHLTKQGFYDILCDFEPIAAQSGGRTRKRQYTSEYFEEEWANELTTREPSPQDGN